MNGGGVAHFIDDGIDTGDIIKVKKFKVDELRSKTGYEIARHTWKILFEILKEIITDFSQNKQIEVIKNSNGKYYSQKMLNDLKKLDLEENIDALERKINALWYPPYPGAYIENQGKKFYLITDEILKEISALYSKIDPLE